MNLTADMPFPPSHFAISMYNEDRFESSDPLAKVYQPQSLVSSIYLRGNMMELPPFPYVYTMRKKKSVRILTILDEVFYMRQQVSAVLARRICTFFTNLCPLYQKVY